MKTLLLILLSQTFGLNIVSGIAIEDLADTPVSDTINMEATKPTNQLALSLAVAPGTSLIVDVRCYESINGTNWDEIGICDTASPSTCVPDVRRYTLADWAGAVKRIASRWSVKKKYVRCSVDDPDDGDGTVTVTGSRSWQ